jgi:hypothetical protein
MSMTYHQTLAAFIQCFQQIRKLRIKSISVNSGKFGGSVKLSRILIYISLGALLLAACGSKEEVTLEMAPESHLSPEVQQAPLNVQEAYRFALANKDLLQQIPCYCGCGGVGHTSNYACYVTGIIAEGNVDFDYHALG